MRKRFEHTAGAWNHDEDEDSVVLAATGQLISRFTRSSYDVDRTISCVNGCDAAGIVEPSKLHNLLWAVRFILNIDALSSEPTKAHCMQSLRAALRAGRGE